MKFRSLSLIFIIFMAMVQLNLSYGESSLGGDYIEKRFKSESYSILYGDVVEEEYQDHLKRLKDYYFKLKKRVQSKAPTLLEKLDKKPPEAIPPGYQRLPKILITEVNYKDPEKRTLESLFSWPSLSSWVKGDSSKLLDQSKLLPSSDKATLEKLVEQYEKLNNNQKTMNRQVQYNRFWQKDVLFRENFYETNTKIYDGIVSGQLSPDEETKKRVFELMSEVPDFITLEEKSPTDLVVRVKMATDIQDETFLKGFQAAIEKFWQASGPINYAVKLDMLPVDVKDLYKGETPPKQYEAIDVNKHVGHFGLERGIVTTGAGVTYYSHHLGRRYFVLGVGDASETVLSHEFGHILTFNDAYFRGARELGDKGFAVLEVVPDVTDIMAAPGLGRVKPYHFEILIDAIRVRDKTRKRRPATAVTNSEK